MKSSTTVQIPEKSLYSHPKEKTPYRADRMKNKYLETDFSTFKPTTSSTSKRSELGLSNGYDSSYGKKSNDSGYYDLKPVGKENIYKSKYDPDVLLSEIASSNLLKSKTSANINSSSSRPLKSYHRTDSGEKHRTAVKLYDLDDEDYDFRNRNRQARNYTQRKSATSSKIRSETQKFFDMEDETKPADPQKVERDKNRDEIQNLIMKYAQIDDFYGKTSQVDQEAKSRTNDVNNNNSNNIWDANSHFQSPVVIPQRPSPSQQHLNALLKSQTMTSIPSNSTSSSNNVSSNASNRYSKYYNYYDNHVLSNNNRSVNYNNTSNLITITTPSGNLNAPTPRSRMSKALSTFVRFFFSFFLL